MVSSETDLRSQLARQRSRRGPSRIHAFRNHDTIIRVWIGGRSGLFLEPWETRHPLSRTRLVTRAHVAELSDKHCNENAGYNHRNWDSLPVP